MTDTNVVDPPVVDPIVPPAEPPAPDPNPEPSPHGNAGKTPWYMQRISEESAKARAEAERAAAAERRAAEAEALARRLQAGQQPPRDDPVPRPPAISLDPNSPEFKSAVDQAASQRRLQDSVNEILRNGYSEFGKEKFDNASNILAALGCASADFLSDVIAAGKGDAHKILAQLAAEPEQAAMLSTLDSRGRIAELTRMQMATKAPKTEPKPADPVPAASKQVSKAPAPAPSLQPTATRQLPRYADELSDEEFTAQWKSSMKERSARR